MDSPSHLKNEHQSLTPEVRDGSVAAREQSGLSPYLLLDSLRQAVIATTPDGKIEYWNKGAERLYGWTADEVIGRSVMDVTVPHLTQHQAREVFDYLQRGEEWSGQFTVHRKDGSVFEADVTDKPVLDENGALVGVIGISEDVSSREEALEALQHSEERFRLAAETVPDIFFITDESIRTLYINRRFTEYTGKPSRYAHGNGWIRMLHPDEVARVVEYWGRCMESGVAAEFKHRTRMADGSYRWFITRSRPIRDADGRIRYWFGTSTDIDDLVRAEEEIKALNASLERRVKERTKQVRALSSALTLAEQRERKRVARFLHDDLQQLLYGIKLKSDALGRGVADSDVRQRLNELGSSLAQAIRSVRSLTIELSPPVLRGEGLGIALEWLAVHLKERYGLHVDLAACAACDVPDEDHRILLFQLIRELLFNVVKHANTNEAKVSVQREDSELVVQVRDDGVGFEVEEINQQEHWDSFGIVSIRERLALFGGALDIESQRGLGTTMTIRIPVEG